MPDQAVRLPENFILPVSRDIEEDIVCIGDPAFQVGLADDDFVAVKEELDARYGSFVTTGLPLLGTEVDRHSQPITALATVRVPSSPHDH